VEEAISSSVKPFALFKVDFSNWTSDIEDEADYHLTKEQGIWTLRPYTEDQPTFLYAQGGYELLNVVKYLVDRREGTLTAREFQGLLVPENCPKVSMLIDTARDPDSSDIVEFRKLVKEADDVIGVAYGLNRKQLEYVRERLDTPPFDVLQPRWPWKGVAVREIQEYDIDRFA
jgi:hypothetical protein